MYFIIYRLIYSYDVLYIVWWGLTLGFETASKELTQSSDMFQ
jgi:hypothetical protein